MKVTKEQSQQNRQALLEAAGRLFKQHGVDGVGVADICREAGLTQGALYKHFADKQDLVAQSFAQAFRKGYDSITRVPAGETRSLETYLRGYLNPRLRDDLASGCPLIATACETARQSEPVSRNFADAFLELREGIAAVLPAGADGDATRQQATLAVAALLGAVALSRGVMKADQALADQVLADVGQCLARLEALGQAPPPA